MSAPDRPATSAQLAGISIVPRHPNRHPDPDNDTKRAADPDGNTDDDLSAGRVGNTFARLDAHAEGAP